jgi:alcohol dehydrogenase (cytochrome c)
LAARTGTLLGSFNTGSGIHGTPVSYSGNGKPYSTVPAGWGGRVDGYALEIYGAPRDTVLVVFTPSD